ncbi:glycosyltransferase [Phenylobacterium sp.]|uniref:glycosyltransferase n=1 Tax=Phenylobacterium sp. TaxID=1871053 RepID=UPI0035B4EC38
MLERVLFVHSNFPAQFRDLARELVARGVACAAIGGQTSPGLEGVRLAKWSNSKASTPGILPLAVRAEADLIRGRAALDAALELKAEGFEPDLIIGHPGWGETVFLEEPFPKARRILFSEFFYKGRGADVGFDDEFLPTSFETIIGATAKNAVLSLALTQADAIVCPTEFQASTHPDIFRPRMRLIHEGVDTQAIRPAPRTRIILPDRTPIEPETPLITHVNRNLEPLRGLHVFLRALPRVLDEAPDARVLIVGAEAKRGYGGSPLDGRSWKEVCLDGLEDRLDWSRVHFLGRLPHNQMLTVLRASTAHVYYSYPFVLSWSLLEAMASGCYIIGSDTAPVRDALADGVNSRLVDFFDVDGLSAALIDACRRPEAFGALRAAARATAVEHFDAAAGRAAWLSLIDEVTATPRRG